MGEFHLRKCDAAAGGGKHKVEAGEIPALMCSTTTAGASCKRRLPQVAEEITSAGPREQGFRISNKRTTTCMMTPPASSSSGNVAPPGSAVDQTAVSSCFTATATDSSSSAAVAGDETATPREMEKHLLQDEEEPRRLGHCWTLEMTVASGKHSHDDGSNSGRVSSSSSSSSLTPCAAPSCCSTNLVEEEEDLAAAGTGELESTASNTTQGSGRPGEPAADGKGPPRHEVPAPADQEIEAFFAKAERELAREFVDKYNYDIVKDTPLEGRYEWARIKPW